MTPGGQAPTQDQTCGLGDADPFIIAEIGVNHDGDPSRAESLVDSAADAGADAVKFQWFEPRRLLSRSARLVEYQKRSGEQDVGSMLDRLCLDCDGMERARLRAVERGLRATHNGRYTRHTR